MFRYLYFLYVLGVAIILYGQGSVWKNIHQSRYFLVLCIIPYWMFFSIWYFLSGKIDSLSKVKFRYCFLIPLLSSFLAYLSHMTFLKFYLKNLTIGSIFESSGDFLGFLSMSIFYPYMKSCMLLVSFFSSAIVGVQRMMSSYGRKV